MGNALIFFHFLDSFPYCRFSSNERIYLSNSQSKEEKPHFFNPTCASFKRCTISGSDRQTRLINVKIGHGSNTNLTCVFWEILHELKSLQTVLSCHGYNPFCGLRITRRMEGDNKVNVIYCTVSNKTTREGNLLRKLNENALFHIAADRSLICAYKLSYCGLEFPKSWLSSHFQFGTLCKRVTKGSKQSERC